jgi:hypothetical protein
MLPRIAQLAVPAALALALLAIPAAASGPAAGELAPVHGRYSPVIDPARFVRRVDNPYLPYRPGARIHFEGVRGRTRQTDDEVVVRRTRRILGVPCTIVRDTVSEHGRAVERTDDYYAQDRQGNVWYMGEDSFERVHGRFARADDSWLAGRARGRPGIIMPAHPHPGDRYRQEYYPPGKALDEARVLKLGARLTVPMGSFSSVLVTAERSPAEPQVERKYYARGVGEIAERVVKGHHEAFQLVRVTQRSR